MTEEQKQALIEYCKEEARLKREHIARLEKHMPGQFNLTKYQIELQVAEIALAALTAPQPVVTGEHLDLLAAHREVADLKEQLAKSEAKFQNMLEAEHRLSDAYIRIRELVGTINLPEGSDVWQATEAAAAKLVAMTGQPVKQPQTHDAHGFPEPAHILNSRWIEAIRAAGYEVEE
ncbi:hypothetical protein HWC07_gp007 [Pantoea phage vB_PagM_LIET2]|uniref:Ead/Ea22-like family protein n=1 Tax=Pantoea phage vB_PagM_LIET2 TaxID=2508071 RepID=A0A411AW00_9CAUD|nr:hypothetical protein HWC07_gp007 [Pantoea phage vB_PagM_LIET2]QAX92259.1 hypothetical protein LIET2_gp007 [Pantoea phage vB_PagM_LIET2]